MILHSQEIISATAWIVIARCMVMASLVAIWMLFHPYKAIKLFGITVSTGHDSTPSRKLAQSIGRHGQRVGLQETVFMRCSN